MFLRIRNVVLVSIISCLLLSQAVAVQDTYVFENASQQLIFERLSRKLRCVTCPNQSLADSHAPVAESMREQIHEMILNNVPEAEIEQHFLDRYGDYVLYKPEFKANTWVLWLGPLVFLFAGLVILITHMNRRRIENL
ncbi:cytochrome c-type biogenesis protein CcmH [Candidatus Berkiella cookevillensis]|uniref:Cytochrome c-type biogenesis protein n=1 Tax=Candidatus Berkiella cookevillensis TaxID=437022 RepID=A0A0Q9YHJ8_9GAMM|nr:cytochrome c-type biogenesis protein [Candidatus Berkiella cookevillensis]MCS5709431.1 cytochrome c-type biogenesis protein CcmH [Candidatus Berkiella cookevillensis]